jgi:hypothetical protein
MNKSLRPLPKSHVLLFFFLYCLVHWASLPFMRHDLLPPLPHSILATRHTQPNPTQMTIFQHPVRGEGVMFYLPREK